MDVGLTIVAAIYSGAMFVAGFHFRVWWDSRKVPPIDPAQVRADIEAFLNVACGPPNGAMKATSPDWKRAYYGCPTWEFEGVAVCVGRNSVLFAEETKTDYAVLVRIPYDKPDALQVTRNTLATFDLKPKDNK